MGATSPVVRALKSAREWQDAQWVLWNRRGFVPGTLDIYEAAAYKKVSPNTVRRACKTGRDGRAKLKHQRLGAAYRFTRSDLDNWGLVPERGAA